jgi:hypothetical protein
LVAFGALQDFKAIDAVAPSWLEIGMAYKDEAPTMGVVAFTAKMPVRRAPIIPPTP